MNKKPYGWVLKTGHGNAFREGPFPPVENVGWKPVYADPVAQAEPPQVQQAAPVHVSVGCMKESNGRSTWMVMLAPSSDTPPSEAFQVYSSASEGRARYTAADLLHRMGQGPMPDPTDFDTDLPAAPPQAPKGVEDGG